MKILVVDDDKDLNRGITTFLNSKNHITESAYNGKEGFDFLQKIKFDMILSDLQMPELDGIGLMEKIIEAKLNIPVIIMTAYASIESAVEAMKIGAEDYLTKPLNLNELKLRIDKIEKSELLKKENTTLRSKILKYEMPEIIGKSRPIMELKELLRRISNDSYIPVSIYGQSGTGKELVAKNIHFMSDRKNKQFVPINCAVLSDELLESELFGYEKGAFTGAVQRKVGIIENYEGGTIFLDEVSELSGRVQTKLLRVLQDMIIQPVGSNEFKKVDVRFICASNKKLDELVSQNKFREDLYYRLNVIEIEVPSLRSRLDDLPLLLNHFINKYKISNLSFSQPALDILHAYDWPGNIRELENLIRMLNVTILNDKIELHDLPNKFKMNSERKADGKLYSRLNYQEAYNRTINDFDKSYLEHHLKLNNFNISRTAEIIGLSRVTLHKKIKEYSIIIP